MSNYDVLDVGTHDNKSCDYPSIAKSLVETMNSKKGILIILFLLLVLANKNKNSKWLPRFSKKSNSLDKIIHKYFQH